MPTDSGRNLKQLCLKIGSKLFLASAQEDVERRHYWNTTTSLRWLCGQQNGFKQVNWLKLKLSLIHILTLPTNREVQISVVAVSLKKNIKPLFKQSSNVNLFQLLLENFQQYPGRKYFESLILLNFKMQLYEVN